jgi:hypothetical protein
VTGQDTRRESKRARGAGGSAAADTASPAAAPGPGSLPTGGDTLAQPVYTDSVSRIASWHRGDDQWPDVVLDAGTVQTSPIALVADYRGSTQPDGSMRWVVNVYVTAQVYGASGRLIDKYRSAWFTIDADTTPDDWPNWIREAVDLHHPDRGGPNNDPTGSYL